MAIAVALRGLEHIRRYVLNLLIGGREPSIVDVMDGTILQTVGLIVLGWLVLAILVGAGLGAFLGTARRLEGQLPTNSRAIRKWVAAVRHTPAQRRRHAHPPAA
jgi:hypothetical protein